MMETNELEKRIWQIWDEGYAAARYDLKKIKTRPNTALPLQLRQELEQLITRERNEARREELEALPRSTDNRLAFHIGERIAELSNLKEKS